jgi:hypothetical protein
MCYIGVIFHFCISAVPYWHFFGTSYDIIKKTYIEGIMKKFGKLAVLIVLVALFGIMLCSCNNGSDTLGKYYEEKSDGTLDESSWIELMKKDKWRGLHL